MLLFFLVVLTVLGLVNFYIVVRALQAIPPAAWWRGIFIAAYIFLSLSFIAGRFLERAWLSPVSEALVWTGSYWFGAMLYFFLAVLFFDLLRLINFVVPFFPAIITQNYQQAKFFIGAGSVILVMLVLLGGHINAANPVIRPLDVQIRKKVSGNAEIRIVAASDIHLGTIIGRARFDRIVEKINGLSPDLVLLPGDIVDEDIGPVIRENLGEALRSIRAKYGVLAITGNHEYIGGADEACRYMAEHGVTVLRDSMVRLENGIQIVGREDRSSRQFAGKRRKPLQELMSGVDPAFPVILMDHQPFHLEEGAAAGIDLQLSGHTHHGQLWPLNFITRAVYEVSWGFKQVGETQVYVSSGVGTWGPPVRTGNRPEIVSIKLRCEP
jgi:predicted MPP superfamily phosphohydrolase